MDTNFLLRKCSFNIRGQASLWKTYISTYWEVRIVTFAAKVFLTEWKSVYIVSFSEYLNRRHINSLLQYWSPLALHFDSISLRSSLTFEVRPVLRTVTLRSALKNGIQSTVRRRKLKLGTHI